MPKRNLKVAAVNAASVYMDKDASIEKVVNIIHEASNQKVGLLVFPEAFVPGYLIYLFAYAPLRYANLISEYAEMSVRVFENPDANNRAQVPRETAEDIQRIQIACRDNNVAVVLGISERAGFSEHTLFNSQVFISAEGALLGVHRKIMPTFAEKSVWAMGGGKTLKCWDMPIPPPPSTTSEFAKRYKLGGLCCGENNIHGALMALELQGEQVHAASWPALCAFSAMKTSQADQIKTLSLSHALSAGVFVIAASVVIDHESLKWIENRLGKDSDKIVTAGSGWSGVADPMLGVLNEVNDGLEDRLVTAELDFDHISAMKVINDSSGHYRRPEVLSLNVDSRAIWEDDEDIANGQHLYD